MLIDTYYLALKRVKESHLFVLGVSVESLDELENIGCIKFKSRKNKDGTVSPKYSLTGYGRREYRRAKRKGRYNEPDLDEPDEYGLFPRLYD